MAFQKEPAFTHGQIPVTGILLCNLGTPDEPTPAALRRYLAQFLSDERVVEIPKLLWMLILHGIILRLRPAKSAAKYASIWMEQGSPLKVWTERQASLLQQQFADPGAAVQVRYGMRYGNPSIASQLDALKAAGAVRILLLSAYPQYSGTTTASAWDAVYQWASQVRAVPELRFVNHYHDDAGYIKALASRVLAHWQEHGRPDQLVMSFHGVPERTLHLGDPYHCECHKTGRLLAAELGLSRDQWKLTFQSRFGKAKWLEPYTEPTLVALAQQGVRRVDVLCPGFTSDCLETLEEIAMEAREAFLHAGGTEFHYVPCVNDSPQWLDALAAVARQHMAGWPAPGPADQAGLAAQRNAALLAGARQ